MLRFFYTIIFIIALPVIFYRLWVKDKKVPGYRIRWPERFGIYPAPPEGKPIVWVHAVSVGEVVAATPLIKRLLQCTDIRLMVTTMTPTGSTRVASTFGDQVLHVYAPYDLPWTVSAFLRRTRPILTIIMETELWPNMLHECAKRKVPTILANARMSERSARGYLRFASATRSLLHCLNYVGAQNADDGERFIRMGLDRERLVITGSVKFDVQLNDDQLQQSTALKSQYNDKRPIFVAASTHEGEDQIIADAFREILAHHPDTLLIIVPRHPERFDDVADLFNQQFQCVRRSQQKIPTPNTTVVIGDTMGEMMLFYGAADIAFVGGSLIEHGGHNVIEPAYWGLPILSGPFTFNFADISKRLLSCDGMVTVKNSEQIAQTVIQWLNNPIQRKQIGHNAKQFAESNRGAVERLMEIIKRYIACE